MPITVNQIKRRLDSVTQRAEAAQANIDRLEGNLRVIEAERSDLEAAYRVFTKLEEEGDEANGAPHGANGSGELTQRALMLLILKESDHPMQPSEILEVARSKHGRNLPSGTLHGNLNRWKKEGRLINSNKRWSFSPHVPCNPQPERPDPVERSEDDDLAAL